MKKFVLCLLLSTSALLSPAFAKTPGEVEVGGLVREVQMQGLFGPSRKLSDYRGKPLVINVWASWCGPCRQEMRSLERLSLGDGGEHFNVIGISTDDYVDKAKTFLQQYNITFSNYIDSKLVLENMLGANVLPLTLLVDAQGKVLSKFYGAKEWDSPEIKAMIAQTFRIKR